jgi:hypothetical protein
MPTLCLIYMIKGILGCIWSLGFIPFSPIIGRNLVIYNLCLVYIGYPYCKVTIRFSDA